MVVHFLGKEKVVGSIPALGSITECSSAWPERLLWEQNVGGSNPSTPTIGTYSSVAERESHKLLVVGSIPTRSTNLCPRLQRG